MSCFKIFKSSAVCSLLSFAKPKALLACDQLRSPHLGHGGSLRTCWDPGVMWSSAFWCAACWSPHKRSATIQSHSNPELASVHDVHVTLGAVWKSVKIRHHGTPKPGESPPFPIYPFIYPWNSLLEWQFLAASPWPCLGTGRCPYSTPTNLDNSSRWCPHWSWSTPRTRHRNALRSWRVSGPSSENVGDMKWIEMIWIPKEIPKVWRVYYWSGHVYIYTILPKHGW